MTKEKKGMLAATIAYSIFGLSYLFSKMALGVTEPMILLAVRFSVTFVILNLLVAFKIMRLNLKGKNLLGVLPGRNVRAAHSQQNCAAFQS